MRKFPVVLAMLALSATSALAQIVKTTCTPSDKEFRKAVKTIMYRTNGHDITPKRMKAMEVTQSVINNFTNSDWRTYRRATAEEAAIMEQSGVPYFLHQSFEKVRKELSKTKVKEGTVAVWLLYNMGYIVKTPTATFGEGAEHRHRSSVPHDRRRRRGRNQAAGVPRNRRPRPCYRENGSQERYLLLSDQSRHVRR